MNANLQQTLAVLGQAIYCDCYSNEFNRYKILGSVTAEGYVEILRGHKNKTIIQTQEFVISCRECGYSRFVKIESMAVNRPTHHAQ